MTALPSHAERHFIDWLLRTGLAVERLKMLTAAMF
jgi:hypothetical protein